MTSMLFILLMMNLPGDVRARGSIGWPYPRGITENHWQGDALSFYQRFRFDPVNWKAVLLTEKDPGEEWADLISAGLQYSKEESFSASAGALRVQFAQGLLLSHPGSWGTTDPLSLSKPSPWRIRLEPAESPGMSDAAMLSGVASYLTHGELSIAGVLGWSHIDTGESGLHRSPGEVNSRGTVTEKLGAFRAGWGPAGLSFASVSRASDSTEISTRVGADLYMPGKESLLTGEFVTDLDSIANFVLSATRGLPRFRHGLTVSRNTGGMPRTAGAMGTAHNVGAGYGIRARTSGGLVVDGGLLLLQREQGNRLRAGIQFTQGFSGRTELSQRLVLSRSGSEGNLSGRFTAAWSPGRNLSLSLKVPFRFYSSEEGASERGAGIETRLRHRLSQAFEYSLSGAACSTDGWESRVYAYSLSFSGQFGSSALYNSAVLLQAAVSVHISPNAVLRGKYSWYSMQGEETLGTGYEETPGSSRNAAGIQLDWNLE